MRLLITDVNNEKYTAVDDEAKRVMTGFPGGFVEVESYSPHIVDREMYFVSIDHVVRYKELPVTKERNEEQ